MLDMTKDVQGITLYAEFRKPGAMMQLMFTPDGYNEEGKEVPAALYRRVLTPHTPKKQWRSSNISQTALREQKELGVFLENDKKDEFAEKRLAFATQLFDGIVNGGWTLTKKPLLIETSKKDLTEIRLGKTPNKLLYRVGLTKDAEGFPKEIA